MEQEIWLNNHSLWFLKNHSVYIIPFLYFDVSKKKILKDSFVLKNVFGFYILARILVLNSEKLRLLLVKNLSF